MDHFDVVLLGAGSASEWIWSHLTDKSIAVIESGRVGGECPYVACVPSKAMLRSAHVRRLLTRAFELGATSKPLEFDDGSAALAVASKRRDRISENRNDSNASMELADAGAKLFRGFGKITGRGTIGILGNGKFVHEISYDALIIDTGSSPKIPRITGLASTPFWTSADALSSSVLPESLAILGGGAIGCELSDIFSAFGSRVHLIEGFEHILPAEDGEIVAVLRDALKSYGVNVVEEAKVSSVSCNGGEFCMEFEDRPAILSEQLIVATGRSPNVDGIGLEALGLKPNPKGIQIDEFCQVLGAENVYAAGDVTAVAPFTHGANYQARVIVDHLMDGRVSASYDAIPRVVYTEPPVASVGIISGESSDSNREIVIARMDLGSTARALADGETKGLLKLFLDKRSGVLVGATAVGPNVDEMISEVSLAIRARVLIDEFAQLVHPFPTYSEGFEPPLRRLLL